MLLRLIALSDTEPATAQVSLRSIHDLLLKLNVVLGRTGDDPAQVQWLMEETGIG